jgi:5'-methylthioadenosine phosphorylase
VKTRARGEEPRGPLAHPGERRIDDDALAGALADAAAAAGLSARRGGTYVCMEGPQFSTRGESQIYRRWGVSVIGMTNMPEAKLAREAELCYATLALATDYDVWHETEAEVTVEAVVANLMKNVATAKSVLGRAIPRLHGPRTCPCPGLLRNAVITSPAAFPDSARRRLDLLIGKYFPPTPPAPTTPPHRPAVPLRAPRRGAKTTKGRGSRRG